MEADNFFNEKYQREMAELESLSKGKSTQAPAAEAMLAMVRKGTLSCGHTFSYPFVLTYNKLVYYPTVCLTCRTYCIVEFSNGSMIEKNASKDKQTIKDIYDIIQLEERRSMSRAVYKAAGGYQSPPQKGK